MPKRIATQTIVIVREGKRITIKPKQSFDYTSAEIKEITSLSKDALRQPINESETVVEVKVPESQVAAVNATLGNAGGISNPDEMTANPDASVPAPTGQATAPVTGTGSKTSAKPAAKSSSKDEEL